jgi:hypothetical protein
LRTSPRPASRGSLRWRARVFGKALRRAGQEQVRSEPVDSCA